MQMPENQNDFNELPRINNDVSNGKVTAKVTNSDGSENACSINIYRDATSPKMYIALNDRTDISTNACNHVHTNTDSMFPCFSGDKWYNVIVSKANENFIVSGSYQKNKYGWFVAAVDNVNTSETVNVAMSESGSGFGAGIKSLEWDYNGGNNFVTLNNSSYNYQELERKNTYNNTKTYKLIAHAAFTQAGNRTINYRVCDYLDNCAIYSMKINITD